MAQAHRHRTLWTTIYLFEIEIKCRWQRPCFTMINRLPAELPNALNSVIFRRSTGVWHFSLIFCLWFISGETRSGPFRALCYWMCFCVTMNVRRQMDLMRCENWLLFDRIRIHGQFIWSPFYRFIKLETKVRWLRLDSIGRRRKNTIDFSSSTIACIVFDLIEKFIPRASHRIRNKWKTFSHAKCRCRRHHQPPPPDRVCVRSR